MSQVRYGATSNGRDELRSSAPAVFVGTGYGVEEPHRGRLCIDDVGVPG